MKRISLLLFSLIILLGACKSDKNNRAKGQKLPRSIGNMGDLIVVADGNTFDGTVGNALDSVLDIPQPYFFNVEGYFRIQRIRPALFQNVSKSYRTLWVVKIAGDELNLSSVPAPFNTLSDSLKKINDTVPVRTYLKKNLWAYPQQVLFIYAKSHNDLYNYLLANRSNLLNKTLEMEMQSNVIKASEEGIDTTTQFLKNAFGFTMAVPKNFRIAKVDSNKRTNKFVWMRRETPTISQGILIYTRPYTSKTQFIAEELVLSRDSVTKKHIPGQLPNSYMVTEKEFSFATKEFSFADAYASEMRALWKTEGDFMGGPFYSISFVDTKTNLLITIEGFVYAPRYDKTQYIRQLESIIKTFQWAK